MQAFLRALPLVLLLLIAGFYLGGRALPEDYRIESEIEVEARPAEVFRHLSDAQGWTRWFTGPEGDVRVESEERLVLAVEGVEHVLELTETSSPARVRYRHFNEGPGALEPIIGEITVEPREAGSTVRIREDVSVSSGTQRWLVYLFGQDLMSQVLDRELHNLKALVDD